MGRRVHLDRHVSAVGGNVKGGGVFRVVQKGSDLTREQSCESQSISFTYTYLGG